MAIYANCHVHDCDVPLTGAPRNRAIEILHQAVAHVVATGHQVTITGTAASLVHDKRIVISRLE